MSHLKGNNLIASYGSVQILNDCSIEVKKGEIAVIVGPNGAGKSTAMKALLGLMQIKSGSVIFNDKDITKLSVQKRIELGMAFVPQTNNIFTSMTIEENLEMGSFINDTNIKKNMEEVYELFPILFNKRKQKAGELSGGQRQQAAFGRAMMTSPDLMLLDEPTAGVSPIIMDEIFSNIINLKYAGKSILMVEQNAQKALEIADKGFLLVSGRNEYSGNGRDFMKNTDIRKQFLGG